VIEHQPPAPLPEFKTPEQLAKWRSEQNQKSQPSASSQEGGVFYTGKPYLAESGSYAFKYRQYSPEMGRWITVDPSGFPDGANNRMYVENCPLYAFDQLGKFTIYYNATVTAYNYADNSPANSDQVASGRNAGGAYGSSRDISRADIGDNTFNHPSSLAVSPEAGIAYGSKVLISGYGWFRVEDSTSKGLSGLPRFDMWTALASSSTLSSLSGQRTVTVFDQNESIASSYSNQGPGTAWNYSTWISESARSAVRGNSYWHGIYSEGKLLE